jgi:hypothetical protein
VSHMIARMIEWKGDDQLTDYAHEMIELTDVKANGEIELRMTVTPKSDNIYVSFQLHELVRLVMLSERTAVDE